MKKFVFVAVLALACGDSDPLNSGAGGTNNVAGANVAGAPAGHSGSAGAAGAVQNGGQAGVGQMTGGSAGFTGSEDDLAQLIEAEIDRLNSCEVVDDCEHVAYPTCSSHYINDEADRSELDRLLDIYRGDDEPVGCLAICLCATLSCANNKCTINDSGCEDTVGPDEMMICR